VYVWFEEADTVAWFEEAERRGSAIWRWSSVDGKSLVGGMEF
jgi:hypothetical protein